jgi:hypothetical protein
MTVKTPIAPALPDELERLLRRLRLPYVRRAAPEVIATANSQRWEHAEVLRVLLSEEAAGRDRATIQTRRRASGLPAGKTFDAWEANASVIPKASRRYGPWNGSTAPRRCASAAHPEPANRISSKRSATTRSTTARPSPGTRWRPSRTCSAATKPTTASTRRSAS